MRKGEAEEVKERFTNHFKTDLHVADARERFLSELKGVSDPQQKRKIIGRVFIEVFRREAESIPDARFLAQGTLYPDVIESGGNPDGPAATIKSHHNVGGLPDELGFELIEPLRDFFKDEVRQMGLELGLARGSDLAAPISRVPGSPCGAWDPSRKHGWRRCVRPMRS